VTGVAPRRGVVVGAASGSGDVFRRLLSLAASVRRGTLKLTVGGIAAAAVIVYFLLRDGFPDDAGLAVLTVIGLAVVVAAPLLLAGFWFVLGQLLQLPERLRALPGGGRDQAEELRRLVREGRSRRGWTSVPPQLWKLARLAGSTRELLTPYAPAPLSQACPSSARSFWRRLQSASSSPSRSSCCSPPPSASSRRFEATVGNEPGDSGFEGPRQPSPHAGAPGSF
jgi:hypothetical protein